MDNLKINLIGTIAVLALIGTVILGLRSPAAMPSPSGDQTAFGAIPSVNAPVGGATLPNGTIVPNPSNFDYLVGRVYLYVDGAFGKGNGTSVVTNEQAVRSLATAATTTPCATQNPFNATSTFSSTFNITTGTSSAGSIVAAISNGKNSTTTVVAQGVSVGASALATLGGSSTASSTGALNVAGPNQWVVWGMTPASAVAYGYTYVGSCTTIFTTRN